MEALYLPTRTIHIKLMLPPASEKLNLISHGSHASTKQRLPSKKLYLTTFSFVRYYILYENACRMKSGALRHKDFFLAAFENIASD